MKYKRLTNNNKNEYDIEIDFCTDCQHHGEPNGCNKPNGECSNYDKFCEMYNRLTELQDKIETGTLIELPCRLGQLVYRVYEKCGGSNCPYNGNYGQWRCKYKEKQRCDAFIDEVSFIFDMKDSIGKTIFLNMNEAEQNLKETKNNELRKSD